MIYRLDSPIPRRRVGNQCGGAGTRIAFPGLCDWLPHRTADLFCGDTGEVGIEGASLACPSDSGEFVFPRFNVGPIAY